MHEKRKFSIKFSISQFPADSVTFTEEAHNEKLRYFSWGQVNFVQVDLAHNLKTQGQIFKKAYWKALFK